jgi:aspartyl aminopeptidase
VFGNNNDFVIESRDISLLCIVDGGIQMTKDPKKKPTYQTPVVVPLGEIAAAAGVCMEGTMPDASDNCTHGTGALLNCGIGYAPGIDCGSGGAVGGCDTGQVPGY